MDFKTVNNTEELNNWKENIFKLEREKNQTVINNNHTNNTNNINYTYHSNNGGHSNYTPHSNGTYHSNYQGHSQYNPHRNSDAYHSNSHTNYTQAHQNYTGPHVNSYAQANHQNYPGEHRNSGSGSYHNNYNGHTNLGHRDGHQNGGHANANGYHNQSGYTQSVPHSNNGSYHSNYHSNSKPHSNTGSSHNNNHSDNSNAHRNYSTHSNTGFDHVNFVPSVPYVYDNEQSDILTLNGIKDIFFYAYDKNNDGAGSQFTYSKEVFYQIEIRQTKDLSGNSKISQWKTIQAFDKVESYRMDTVDPLKTGNTNPLNSEGYYELRVTAKNNSYNGVDFIGKPLVKEIKIQQNAMPTIVVDNPEEFLSFTFGFEGVLNKKSEFMEYQDMTYKESQYADFKGLFINVGVLDTDIEDYLKGEVKIKSGNDIIASTNIIWDNGSEIIKSENKTRDGYIYISKDNLLKGYNETSFKNAVVEIHLRDYKDDKGTIPKGDFVISRKVNMTSGEDLFINIDKVAPKMSSISGLNTVGQTATINLTITDDVAGVKNITLPNGTLVNSHNASYTVNKNGLYSFILQDNINNARMYTVQVTGVDTKKPVVTIINEENWTNKDVNVTITATDN